MRIFNIAIFILCINLGINLAVSTALFEGGFFYEDELTVQTQSGEVDFLSDTEQLDVSVEGLRDVIALLKWDWIKIPFTPFLTSTSTGMVVLNTLVGAANVITGLLLMMGFIQFVRNLISGI